MGEFCVGVVSSSVVTLTGPDCTVTVSLVTRHAIHTVYAGHLDGRTSSAVLAEIARFIGDASNVALFCDATAITGYDTSARLKASDWMTRMGDKVSVLHVLQRSAMVAIGAAVMNAAVAGKMRIHSERERFEEALRAARES